MIEFYEAHFETIITGGAIFILILISAIFSGSETALTATSRAKIKNLQKKRDPRAERVANLLDNQENLIGSILLGNNLVNILSASIATSFFMSLVGPAGVVYATLLMTFLILIFAEVLPKTYAIQNSERFALFIAPLMQLLVFVSKPFVLIIRLIVNATLAIFGLKANVEMDEEEADAEIRGNIDLQHEDGVMVKNDRDMLGGVLDLKQINIEDVMVHRTKIYALDVALGADEIAKRILKNSFTRVPIYDEEPDNFIGIMHSKDLLRALNMRKNDDEEIDVRSLVSKIWYVPETTSLQDQLNNFLKRKTHFAMVVDEYGVTQGLITLEDILEEIVGDIVDEHDTSVVGVRPLPNGAVNVDGHVSVRDLNRAMDWDLPQDDAVTIAGLVINEARIIPNVGQAFHFYDCKFDILRKQDNRITSIRITPLNGQSI